MRFFFSSRSPPRFFFSLFFSSIVFQRTTKYTCRCLSIHQAMKVRWKVYTAMCGRVSCSFLLLLLLSTYVFSSFSFLSCKRKHEERKKEEKSRPTISSNYNILHKTSKKKERNILMYALFFPSDT